MTSQMGIPFLQVEMDAKIVVDLVLSNSISNKAYSPLLNDCRFLLHKFWQVKVKHIFQEVNKVAAGLARKGCLQQADFVVFTNSPFPVIASFVMFDSGGLYSLRHFATTMTALAS